MNFWLRYAFMLVVCMLLAVVFYIFVRPYLDPPLYFGLLWTTALVWGWYADRVLNRILWALHRWCAPREDA